MSVALNQIKGTGSQKMTADSLKKSIELVNHILIKAFAEPELVKENPGEDQICLEDLSDDDRGFVYQFVQGGSAQLKNFRSK